MSDRDWIAASLALRKKEAMRDLEIAQKRFDEIVTHSSENLHGCSKSLTSAADQPQRKIDNEIFS